MEVRLASQADCAIIPAVAVSTDVFHPEEATSRPLAPTTQPGSESGQANATDGSHVSLIPEVFPDIDDRLYQLPTPLSPSKNYILQVLSFIHLSVLVFYQ